MDNSEQLRLSSDLEVKICFIPGTCVICLTVMKPRLGNAIFTVERSHSFHFHCITSNVKHRNQICPVCRAKWKEVPFQGPAYDVSQGASQSNQPISPQGGGDWPTVFRRLPSPQVGAHHQSSSPYQVSKPGIFNDDDALDQQTPSTPYKLQGNTPIWHVSLVTASCVILIPVLDLPVEARTRWQKGNLLRIRNR
ncbi:hypothetical protein K1719_044699 [Acacia pycnantha]|nr:hypothetical protein K1719_044699 [Acacia pycnantha]